MSTSPPPHWFLIRNPSASSGKGEKHWPRIQQMLEQAGISFTENATIEPGHATALCVEAISNGARFILALGGDGTINEVANGILSQDVVPSKDITLAQIPIGTGNDWGRTLGIPKDYSKAIAAVQGGKTILQDVGKVHFQEGNSPTERFFVNIAGMGFDAEVGKVANKKKAEGKGGITGYVSTLVHCLRHHKAQALTFSIDGKTIAKVNAFSLVVGICNYNGGGMKQCPNAIIDDGLLDLTMIEDIAKLKVIRNIPNLFTGKFVRNKEVSLYQGKEVLVEGENILLETDGEVIGYGPARFVIEEKRLKVVVQ